MSALGDYVLWQRKTTSVEGRHCICSEHPVFEYPPRIGFSDEQRIVGGCVHKEVNGTVD